MKKKLLKLCRENWGDVAMSLQKTHTAFGEKYGWVLFVGLEQVFLGETLTLAIEDVEFRLEWAKESAQ